jgi:hypothetical protein
MKATAGKVMVVSAVVLVLGLAAASSATAASKNNTTSTEGAVWGTNNSTHPAPATSQQGHQVEQSNREHGCFAGSASDNARCIARAFANKVVSLVDTAIWGGGGFGPPPK